MNDASESEPRTQHGPMAAIAEQVLARAKSVHRYLRLKKVRLFFTLAGEASLGSLLDIGGGSGIAGEFLTLYEAFDRVVIVNLDPPEYPGTAKAHLRNVRADGCCLPFAPSSFDWIFSNAVIEHVGGWDRQRAFAAEVRRMARIGYFVTTPDKYFPIEPHTLLPFYQFLPAAVQKRVAPYTFGYLKHYEEINLLSAGQLQKLFPEATIRRVGFPLRGNSLVALYRR